MYKSKVIVMDVDGTLVDSSKKITSKTKNILIDLQKRGTKVILASGRQTLSLLQLSKELELEKYNGLLISYNGSKITDASSKEVYFNEPLSIEDGKAVLNHMKKFNVIPMIDKDEYMFVNNVYNNTITYNNKEMNIIEHESRAGNFKLCEIPDLESFANYPLNKILTAGTPEYLQKVYMEMMEPFKDTLNCVFTAPFYFEFTAKGIDKAKALNHVLTDLGYKREDIIAFGDGHNDKTMLEYAGHGVAMGNAVDAVKEIAQEVTLSNDEDGIYYSLIKLFDH